MKPTLVLMTKGGNKIGALPASSIVFRTSMREYSEFSFDIYKEKCADLEVWNKLVDFKLLWAVEWNKLYELKINLKESTETVKSVEARSLGESELSQINLYGIEINTEADISRDDYKPTILYCAKNDDNFSKYDSLLTRITEKVPHYEIKTVDASIASIQRTFTFDGKSIYDAFQEISEEIQCLFIINCYLDLETGAIKREIKVRDLLSYCNDCQERGDFINACSKCGSTDITQGYGEDTSIFISTENLADEINYTENSDSVKNCFKLEAGDDLMTATIINCNPNGSSYIWHFSDDMKSDMSDELQNKLNEYDTNYNSYQSAAIELPTSDYDNLVDKYNKYVTSDYGELHERIDLSVKGYPALMQAEYNVIDFGLYLKNGFMPSPTMNNETASKQINAIAAKFSGTNPYRVAVKSLSSVTKSTAESYILQIVKTIISKQFKVEIISGSLSPDKKSWAGAFKLTNSNNEDDAAPSSDITIYLTDDNAEYVRQRIEQVLDKKVSRDDSAMGAKELFGRGTDSTNFKYNEIDFKNELKKYGLVRLQSFHDACQACLDIMIEQGISSSTSNSLYESLYLPYWNRLSLIEAEIKERESEISIIETLRNSIEKKQLEIQKELELKQYLGDKLWKELMSYRREDTYNNSNYISDGLSNADIYKNAKDFIEVANRELYKSSTQQHSITASLKNLLFMKEFSPIVDNFETGNWIRIKTDGKLYRLRLLEYEIDFENPENIAVTFSDVTKIQGGYSDIESILNQASSMATSYDYVARQSKAGKSAREIVDGWVDRGLALTTQKIINDADNQSITMDSNGLLCKEYDSITDTFNDNQVKIINKGLYITNDNWKTAKAGIGAFTYTDPVSKEDISSYGVIADTIVGKIILSENVGIYNSNNSVNIDKDGFVITTPKLTPTKSVFTIRSETGENTYKDLFVVNTDGSLTINGYATEKSVGLQISASAKEISTNISNVKENLQSQITQNAEQISLRVTEGDVGSIIETKADSIRLKTTTLTWQATNSSLTSDGTLTATNGNFSGEITATGGTIGGFMVDESKLSYGTVGKSYALLIYPNGEKNSSGNWVYRNPTTFAIESNTNNPRANFSLIIGKSFGVSDNGILYASGAEISGKITATKLTLDGCKISTSDIDGLPTMPDTSLFISVGGAITEVTDAETINQIQAGTYKGSSPYFSVSNKGLLVAANAVVKGKIYATEGEFTGKVIATGGKIGVWEIGVGQAYSSSATKLFSNNISKNDSGEIISGTEIGFNPISISDFIYSSEYNTTTKKWENKFQVSRDGTMTCKEIFTNSTTVTLTSKPSSGGAMSNGRYPFAVQYGSNVNTFGFAVDTGGNVYAEKFYTNNNSTDLQTQINSKASSSHTHSNYALTSHTHGNTQFWSGNNSMGINSKVSFNTNLVSNTNIGIVLVFSYYNSDSDKAEESLNWSWQSFFIPKSIVPTSGEVQMLFRLSDSCFGNVGTKYLYISDSYVEGHANNTTEGTGASGIKYKNNLFVLRRVYGV